MRLSELEQRNSRASLSGSPDYYGFYEVDIFDVEPFLMFSANDCPRYADVIAGVFEPYSIHVMQNLLRSGTAVFLDVGAHVGMYSLVAAATASKVRIIAFEPNPFAFTRLSLHARVNGWHERIVLNPFGLSNVSGVQFYDWVDKGHGWISSGGGFSGDRVVKQGRCRLVAVSQVLDEIADSITPGDCLIKLDVEGHEVNALKGMQSFISQRKPDVIIESFSREACQLITAMMSPWGYKYYLIDEINRRLVERPELVPADLQSASFNQLMTTKSMDQMLTVLTMD